MLNNAAMKIKIILQLILIFSFYLTGFSQEEEKALALLKKYNHDGYFIITEYIKSPSSYKFGNSSMSISKDNSFKHYIDGTKTQDIVNSLGTVVHEMNHAFTGIYAYQKIKNNDFDYDCIYIKDKKYIIVKYTETFPSKLIEKIVPKKLQTFRFSTYISKSSKYQSTQSSGIYGLLDEFNAYYQGTKTDFLMYDYYLNETKGEIKDWQSFMRNFDGTYFAYAEFRFYILKYLIYAKKNEKEIYENIIVNNSFKEAFNTVDTEFSKLISDYFILRTKLLKNLEQEGHRTSIDNEFTYIGDTGTGNYISVYNLLMNEMKQTKYKTIINKLKE